MKPMTQTRIFIDGTTYYVDAKESIDTLRLKWELVQGMKIKIPHGPIVDLASGNVITAVLRQLCILLVIPILNWMAEPVALSLPKKEKREDPIRYVVKCYFILLEAYADRADMVLESEKNEDGTIKITAAKFVEKARRDENPIHPLDDFQRAVINIALDAGL